MEELTTKQKIIVIKKAIKKTKNILNTWEYSKVNVNLGFASICFVLRHIIVEENYVCDWISTKKVLVLIPELIQYKPVNVEYDNYWWEFNKRSFMARLKVLVTLLKELEDDDNK